MAIEWDEGTRSFLLTGGGFSYAFAVDRDGTPLRHLHWGGVLGPADLPALIAAGTTRAGSNTWSRPRAHTEELVVHGGARFDETPSDRAAGVSAAVDMVMAAVGAGRPTDNGRA